MTFIFTRILGVAAFSTLVSAPLFAMQVPKDHSIDPHQNIQVWEQGPQLEENFAAGHLDELTGIAQDGEAGEDAASKKEWKHKFKNVVRELSLDRSHFRHGAPASEGQEQDK